jgi:hypothetical protein
LKSATAAALAHHGVTPADIPRRIFEEFYSSGVEPRSAVRSKFENSYVSIQPAFNEPGSRGRSCGSAAQTRFGGAKLAVAPWRYPAGCPRDLRSDRLQPRRVLNGIAWNLLHMAIAVSPLLGRLHARPHRRELDAGQA